MTRRIHSSLRIAPIVALPLLSACTTIQDYLDIRRGESPAEPAAIPLAERPELEPIDPNRFVLQSAEQSVIGTPQVVYTTRTDTLSDLAREYGLGYDEIVAANPDVQSLGARREHPGAVAYAVRAARMCRERASC